MLICPPAAGLALETVLRGRVPQPHPRACSRGKDSGVPAKGMVRARWASGSPRGGEESCSKVLAWLLPLSEAWAILTNPLSSVRENQRSKLKVRALSNFPSHTVLRGRTEICTEACKTPKPEPSSLSWGLRFFLVSLQPSPRPGNMRNQPAPPIPTSQLCPPSHTGTCVVSRPSPWPEPG